MGLGPSIKMTTLHHYRCPLTARLSAEPDVEFAGIVVDGVSENYVDKCYTADRTAEITEMLGADGAIVAIDGWGNHHVDFVRVLDQIGRRGIPAVGLSYLGQQGRLVCTSPYVDLILDFNKSASGYESCVVGQNNLNDYDAMKAVALLKNKMRKAGKFPGNLSGSPGESPDEPGKPAGADRTGRTNKSFARTKEICQHRLVRKTFPVKEVVFGERTAFARGVLTLDEKLREPVFPEEERIRRVRVRILPPGERHVFVNSNLDFSPIACKADGVLGAGTTYLLSGAAVMLTGVEEKSGFQPGNIGSSEGFLDRQVVFDQAGTPASSDYLLHIDVLFKEVEGRTAEGIMAAHRAADRIVQEIRKVIQGTLQTSYLPDSPYQSEELRDIRRPGCPKIVLVKIVSGLGNMYDTAMFPAEPGGFNGSRSMMRTGNLPYVISGCQCRDGVIHSLV